MSDDGDELASAVRQMLAAEAPLSAVRARIDGHAQTSAGPRPAMARMGLTALPVPEADGGQGAGWEITVRVFEELGRVLESGPYLSTVGLAVPTLMRCASEEAQARLLPRAANDDLCIAYAANEERGDTWSFTQFATHAEPTPGGWRLSGAKTAVLNADESDVHLVAATTAGGVGLFLVERAAAGVTVEVHPSVDLTRPVSTVRYEFCEAVPVHRTGLTAEDMRVALDIGRLAIAAEAVGVAQACLDMAVAYARERHQFGRAIGSFQSIKHMCAEVLLEVEGARSAVYAAGAALDAGADEALAYTCLAKLVAGDVVREASQVNIQVHGGMGFTWEHDAHLYYRRAIADALLLGDSSVSRARLMHHLGVSA